MIAATFNHETRFGLESNARTIDGFLFEAHRNKMARAAVAHLRCPIFAIRAAPDRGLANTYERDHAI
jgi:hypothetical protein